MKPRPIPPVPAARPSFEDACLPHTGALLAMATRISHSKIHAEDLVQDTLIAAMQAWHRYQERGHVRAWLFKILSDTFITAERKRQYRYHAATAYPLDVARVYGNVDTDPDDALADQVIAALKRLDPACRAVVERVDLDDTTYKDAARALGIPPGTVMSRLHRARRELESALAEYAETEYGIRRSR